MQTRFNHNRGIFLFNILPRYRPGMSDVFDYSREKFTAASLPSEHQRRLQNTMFMAFENVCGECLSNLDLLYVFATDGDSDYAKINWVYPGSFIPTEVNTITFTSNIGFNGNASNSYINTGFIPSTHGVNYQANDASVLCYIASEISSNAKLDFGVNSGISDPSILLNSRNASNQHSFRINFASAVGSGVGKTSTGFFHLQKTATGYKLYKNASEQITSIGSIVATGVPDRFIPLFANNNNGTIGSFSDRRQGLFGLGASLSGGESSLYDAWNNYFTSL